MSESIRRQLQIVDKEIELRELGLDIFQITFLYQIGDAHLDHRMGFDGRARGRPGVRRCTSSTRSYRGVPADRRRRGQSHSKHQG